MLALIFFFVLEVDIDIQKTKGYKGARAFDNTAERIMLQRVLHNYWHGFMIF